MSTTKDLRELKELIDSRPKAFEKSTQGVKQALETVELNNQWKINMYMDLSRRLNQMGGRNFDFTWDDTDDDDTPKGKQAVTVTVTEGAWYMLVKFNDDELLLRV